MKLYLIFLLSLMAIALGDGEENPSGDEIEVEEEVLVSKDVNFDADDESLADDGGLNVAVDKMSIVIDGRKDIDLDLTGLQQNFAISIIIFVPEPFHISPFHFDTFFIKSVIDLSFAA